MSLHEAVKLSDALLKVRARLLGLEDDLGDDAETRAVVAAFWLGYEAGREDAQNA